MIHPPSDYSVKCSEDCLYVKKKDEKKFSVDVKKKYLTGSLLSFMLKAKQWTSSKSPAATQNIL
jgi:hypothetical protein